MTVQQLRVALSQYDDDLRVMVLSNESMYASLNEVDTAFFMDDRLVGPSAPRSELCVTLGK